ncbi:uncharacterized protein BJ171DRAFT_43817 [Polychytrium aggregatum]|uniref:uncharacterized protein n=1 Tax=Polychytrium aggregatum TaxID=110093 RepID=UPI0022FEE55B|nr:uncharacterized protein BJ171DRAFT_43817 [Polychytrium aggregatum]KAI9206237.1 hypothetical protein BJ171DRAFT_43817 [Polychytrium aggregatum]
MTHGGQGKKKAKVVYHSTGARYVGNKVSKKEALIHKAKVKRQYHKLLKEEGLDNTQPVSLQAIDLQPETQGASGAPQKPHSGSSKPTPFKKVQMELDKKKAEEQRQREEEQKQKEEQRAKRAEYYAKRREDRNMMLKKTKKGQPVISNQISRLLGKLQKQ